MTGIKDEGEIKFIKANLIKYLVLVFMAIPLFSWSCSKKIDSSLENKGDEFVIQLKEIYPEIKISQTVHPGSSALIMPKRLGVTDNGRLIVEDADKIIHLMSDEGEILHTAGGEGSGPGEFQSITQLHIGFNDRLYLRDGKLFRINVYEIVNDELKFIRTIGYKNPASHYLTSIYVTEFGRFGLFNIMDNFYSPDNHYQLYRVDNNFSPLEQLLTLPGSQRPKYQFPEFSLYLVNIFAENIFWDLDGEWFYYLNTHKSEINKYHLPTGRLNTVSFLNFPERRNSSAAVQFAKEQLSHIKDDQYWDVLEKSDYLPFFWSFRAQDRKLLMTIFYPAGEEGITLYADQNLDNVQYFRSPQGMDRFILDNETVYGIDSQAGNEAARLIKIEL